MDKQTNYINIAEPLKEIFRMIDRLEGFSQNQINLIKNIAEKSFEKGYKYSL